MFDKHNGGLETYPMAVFLTLIIWVFIIRQMILANVNSYASTATSFGILYDFAIIFTFCFKQKEFMIGIIEFVFKTIIAWMLFEYLIIY